MDIGALSNNAKPTCITITLQKYTVIPKRHNLLIQIDNYIF